MTVPLKNKYEVEREARELADRLAFDAVFAEWLSNRATSMSPPGEWEDDVANAHTKREYELARLVTCTPAVLPWMIFCKLEVLEHYLGGDDGTNWTDNREIVMFAGIKADLLRFPPKECGR